MTVERANRTAAQLRAQESAADALFRAPLRAPTSAEERPWYMYLVEAFFRVDPEWSDTYPATSVLRAPSARNYEVSETNLCDEFTDTLLSPVTMLASPAPPEHFLGVLERCVAQASPNRFVGQRIYVAISPAYGERTRAALARTGADVIILDPAVAIPQRPERLARRDAARSGDAN